jgi:hypothetical protein
MEEINYSILFCWFVGLREATNSHAKELSGRLRLFPHN